MHRLILIALLSMAGPLFPTAGETLDCKVDHTDNLGETAGERQVVIVSDLHLGVGKSKGKWHNFEDFRWHDEFKTFLEYINGKGGGKTDLVFNGDTLELWQSVSIDCKKYHFVSRGERNVAIEKENFGCSEEDAQKRIATVLEAHSDTLKVIAEFAGKAQNRVIVIPGNHDAALLFPAVLHDFLTAKAFRSVPSGRILVQQKGYWTNGHVYVEHGHQIGRDVNKWDEWPCPFIVDSDDNKVYLKRPWGERFVQEYYNKFELLYPVIDNLDGELTGLSYGIAKEGVSSVKDAMDFAQFFLFDVSFDQFVGALGPQEGSTWNIDEVQKWSDEKLRTFLSESLITATASTDSIVRAALTPHLLADERALELVNKVKTDRNAAMELCDRRLVIRKRQSIVGEKPIETCPVKAEKMGAITETVFRNADAVRGEHIGGVRTQLLNKKAIKEPFTIFVYSHTHKAEPPRNIVTTDKVKTTIVNTGAWQRLATVDQLKLLKVKRHIKDKDVLSSIKLLDLPDCYSYVLIPPFKEAEKSASKKKVHSSPLLKYWVGKAERPMDACRFDPK